VKLDNSHIAPAIPVTELEEAERFYGDKLRLDLGREQRDRGKRLYEACDGIYVLICRRRTLSVPDATAMTLLVKDLSQKAGWLRDRESSSEAYDVPRMVTKPGAGSPMRTATWQPGSGIRAATSSALPRSR
jgi:hypothetical protein